MNKKHLFLIGTSILALGLLAGCSEDVKDFNPNEQPKEEVKVEPKNEAAKVEEPKTTPEVTKLEFEGIKEKLVLNTSTREEVEEFLKVKPVEVISAMDGNTMYRYDVNFPTDYKFLPQSDNVVLDDIDVEGIKKHKGMVVMLEYKEDNTLLGYSVSHLNEDGKVNVYYNYPKLKKTDVIE